MNKTIRLALIGASILALTSPVLARTVVKSDRVTSPVATGAGQWNTAPVAMREYAPGQIYGGSAEIGHDRASSPYQGGGY
jgi:hypothetical protein